MKMTKEEIIQYYTKYPGQNVIDCIVWQQEILMVGRFKNTIELMVEKNYPEEKIEDYLGFVPGNEKEKVYLQYVYEEAKKKEK